MKVNKLAVLRTYLETISQYESPIKFSNEFKTGLRDKYIKLNRLSLAGKQFDIEELCLVLKRGYYKDYYDTLQNSSIIYFLENGEKISNIYHLFDDSGIDFPLEFLEKSLEEVEQFGDWLYKWLTLETDCWAATHETYRWLNKLQIRIKNLIEEKTLT